MLRQSHIEYGIAGWGGIAIILLDPLIKTLPRESYFSSFM